MRLITSKPWSSAKPTPASQIDWSHSLAQNLQLCVPFNERAGIPREIVTQLNFSGTIVWDAQSRFGASQKVNALAGQFLTATADSRLTGLASNPITICCFGFQLTAGPNQTAFGFYTTGTTGAGRYGIQLNGTSHWALGGTSGTVASTLTSNSTSPFFVCISYDNSNIRFFVDGNTQTVANAGGTTTASTVIYIGGDNNATNSNSKFNGAIAGAYMWNRILSFTEMESLYASPWQFFQRPRRSALNRIPFPLLDRRMRQQDPSPLVRM